MGKEEKKGKNGKPVIRTIFLSLGWSSDSWSVIVRRGTSSPLRVKHNLDWLINLFSKKIVEMCLSVNPLLLLFKIKKIEFKSM